MSQSLIEQIEKAIEKAAVKARDQDFKNNPNGYTVAPYVNSHTVDDAFEDGALFILPLLKKLVEALEFYADGTNYESIYEDDEMDLHRIIDREDVSFDEDHIYFGHAGEKARKALQECEGIE